MPDIVPDWDEFGRWLESNPFNDVEGVTFEPDNSFEISRVPLNKEGTIFAVVYSLQEEVPSVSYEDLNLEPLMQSLGIDNRPAVERLIEDIHVPQPLPPTWQRSKHTRGPYYGRDQLAAKLDGMRSAWGAIRDIYVIEADDDYDLDAYYVEVDDTP
jgi:hypothetical protein